MRTSLLAATAALALIAAPVLAQTSGSPTAPRSQSTMSGGPGATGATVAPRAPMPDPLTQEDVSRVKGADVYGADGKKIGTIDTVLMNPQSKSIDRLVVRSGAVLGVGGHGVALPVDQFSWDSSKEGFKLAKTADDLKNMPEWKSASSSATGTTSSGSSGAATPRTGTTGAGTTR